MAYTNYTGDIQRGAKRRGDKNNSKLHPPIILNLTNQ